MLFQADIPGLLVRSTSPAQVPAEELAIETDMSPLADGQAQNASARWRHRSKDLRDALGQHSPFNHVA
jgi:hypothetical protein